MPGGIDVLVLGGRYEKKRRASQGLVRECRGSLLPVEGVAMPGCPGGETPHFLLGVALRKGWMIAAVLSVIFGVAFDTSAPLLTPSSYGAAVSLLSVQTSVFPGLPEAWPSVLLLLELPEGIPAGAPALLG